MVFDSNNYNISLATNISSSVSQCTNGCVLEDKECEGSQIPMVAAQLQVLLAGNLSKEFYPVT